MENASKALIIAGAILIAILLITIGIILISSGRSVTDTGVSTMNSQKIQAFNNQFTPYEGTKTGSQLTQLNSLVNASNASDPDHKVVFGGDVTFSAVITGRPTTVYNVELGYSTEGYVNTININKTTTTP